MDIAEYSLFERLALLVGALPLSLILTHPVIESATGITFIRTLWHAHIMRLAQKMNRTKRSVAVRIYRGMVMLAYTLVISLIIASVLLLILDAFTYGLYIELAMLAYLLPAGRYMSNHRSIARAIPSPNALPLTRNLLSTMMIYQPRQDADIHTVIRHGISISADRFISVLCSGIIIFALFGLLGLMAALSLHLLMHITGTAAKDHLAFGWATRQFHHIVFAIPVRLSSLIFAFASLFVPKASPGYSLLIPIKHAGECWHSTAAWPEATMAGALGITLGGTIVAEDKSVYSAWLGRGTAKLTVDDVKRSYLLLAIGLLLIFLLLTGLLFIVGT